MRYLTVDGMMSGTGVRDTIAGGYVEPSQLGLTAAVANKISTWVREYTEAHYNEYTDGEQVRRLDEEGLAICVLIRRELEDAKVEYFSDAKMLKLSV